METITLRFEGEKLAQVESGTVSLTLYRNPEGSL